MSISFTSNDIGKVIATLTPAPAGAADLALYAEASGDMNPLHLDIEFARSAGFDKLVVHGMLGMAHMGRLLTNTFLPASIKSFSARFTAVILAGEQLCYEATLVENDGDFYTLSLEATAAAGVVAIKGDAIIDAHLAGTCAKA
jgi:acyl dehydratase